MVVLAEESTIQLYLNRVEVEHTHQIMTVFLRQCR